MRGHDTRYTGFRPCHPCGFRAGLCPLGFGWMVVRFVRVIRVSACARVSRVSRVCPGSPRCLLGQTAHEESTQPRLRTRPRARERPKHNKKRGASASPTSNSQPFKSRGIPTVQYLEPCVSRLPPVSFYRVSRLFCVSGPVRACVLSVVEIWVSRLPPARVSRVCPVCVPAPRGVPRVCPVRC